MTKAGLQAKDYAGHSFRIGAATTAGARGVPDSTIKILGRWESSAYLLYIRTPRDHLASISAVSPVNVNQYEKCGQWTKNSSLHWELY